MAPNRANDDAALIAWLRDVADHTKPIELYGKLDSAAERIEALKSERDALAAVIEAVRADVHLTQMTPDPNNSGAYVLGANAEAAIFAQPSRAEKVLAARDAKVLRDAADAMDLPGSQATGYYAGESDAGYREATRDAEKWFHDNAARIEGSTQ
jgi:hypothetical protein